MTTSSNESTRMPTARRVAKKGLRAIALVSGIFLISAPLGQAIPGAGTVGGFETVTVKGCPSSKLLFGMETTLEPDGDFVATSLFTGVVYQDLANVDIGRRVQIVPDSGSLAAIVAQWASDATIACLETITISNVEVRNLNIRFSKKGFDAVWKGKFVGDASGTTKSGPTSLSVKARGPWFPGATLY